MHLAALRPEERLALLVALLLHLGLVAALVLQPDHNPVVPMPERMTVSLASDVGLQSTAPELSAAARAAQAPVIADVPAPPELAEAPRAEPVPAPPRPAQARPDPQPRPKVQERTQQVAKPSPAKPATRPAQKKGGASRIGDSFLDGAASGSANADSRLPASQIGASAKASLSDAIGRQLKPHWSSPQGADAELLVTVLAFDLNPDGSLAGTPRVVRQAGVTAANQPQAGRHAELAIRAVQLAAPFDLPPEYYNAWKRISAFRFDRKLSQ
ncbi:MAG: energy transducer TonB [Novosphingobium sp.]|nr:energy transducer TonB [Novosphingobium sp.]